MRVHVIVSRLALLLVLAFSGCASVQTLDGQALVRRYNDTVFEPGATSMPPSASGFQGGNPVYVAWWYTGSTNTHHELVLRQIRWDMQGDPTGEQHRYRTPVTAIGIAHPFSVTRDENRWSRLHEMTEDVRPPADLPTRRVPSTEIYQRMDPADFDPADFDPAEGR